MKLSEYIEHLQHGNICQRASAIALDNGEETGSHHLKWVIDQMLRTISGAAYQTLMENYNSDEHEWDTGIAP